jgi:hypothetical protein
MRKTNSKPVATLEYFKSAGGITRKDKKEGAANINT